MTNAQEFRAGTDPRNPASVFRLAPPVAVGADKTLDLSNLAGRTYRIDFANALSSPTSWVVLTDPGAAALPPRFYRGVVLP